MVVGTGKQTGGANKKTVRTYKVVRKDFEKQRKKAFLNPAVDPEDWVRLWLWGKLKKAGFDPEKPVTQTTDFDTLDTVYEQEEDEEA